MPSLPEHRCRHHSTFTHDTFRICQKSAMRLFGLQCFPLPHHLLGQRSLGLSRQLWVPLPSETLNLVASRLSARQCRIGCRRADVRVRGVHVNGPSRGMTNGSRVRLRRIGNLRHSERSTCTAGQIWHKLLYGNVRPARVLDVGHSVCSPVCCF